MQNKKAQVTIFIIVGVLLITALMLFFLLKKDILPGVGIKPEENPIGFLEICIENKLIEGTKLISSQGGNMNPILYKRFKFDDEDDFVNISYLCYNQNHIFPCINQEPMLIQHLKSEVKKYILDNVQECFDNLVLSLDKKKYTVDATYKGFEVKLMPKKIVIEINAEMTLTKTEESLRYENFTIIFGSRFYEMAIVAQEIINQETRFCYFELLGFMLFYPEFHIDVLPISDATKIYTIKHQDSEDKFRFAIRGCETLPGF